MRFILIFIYLYSKRIVLSRIPEKNIMDGDIDSILQVTVSPAETDSINGTVRVSRLLLNGQDKFYVYMSNVFSLKTNPADGWRPERADI